MIHVKSPVYLREPEYDTFTSVFIAGGISDCPDWQQDVGNHLSQLSIDAELLGSFALFNPRRKEWKANASLAEVHAQIEWEHIHLHHADAIMFWFPHETICPITLFELGAWLYSWPQKPIFIGTHKEYSRRIDVEHQTKLIRPELTIRSSLKDVCKDMLEWYNAQ